MRSLRRAALDSLLVAAAMSAVAVAQTTVFTFHGVEAVDKFGYNVRTVGDVDADGIADFIYSSPFLDTNGRVNNGIARVHSGATGAVLHDLHGPLDGDEFGYSVDGAGDVDGDGHADFVLTRLVLANRFTGEARVYSGATGSVLHTFVGNDSYDFFGISAAGVGDVDGDGYDDVAVSAPGKDDNGSSSGEVNVYSGKTGTLLHSWDGDHGGDQFGWWISNAGDVDADGFPDLVVGAPTADSTGKSECGIVRIFSGRTGAVIRTLEGDAAGDNLGWNVSTAGDVDHDGHADVLAGAHLSDGGAPNAGMARVYSGLDGSVLRTWYGDLAGDEFGWSVRNAGDVDADGYEDQLVGGRFADANGVDSGVAKLFSGRTGALLHTWVGHDGGDQMGYSVGSAGDVDADGYDDVIIGAAFDDSFGANAGVVRVDSFGGAAVPPRHVLLSMGCPCSNGKLPRIGIHGRAALGGSYALDLRGALPNAIAFVNVGVYWNQALGALAPGCTIVPYPLDLFPTLTDANGLAAVTPFTAIPNDPGLVGVELHHQWFVLDPSNNVLGVAASNALKAIVGV
ncbi:MAG: FG-GAP repeat protein [Planctomycetes bacterium]|nr:FG-GAP repeat protein [Planctomycetota bacterium]